MSSHSWHCSALLMQTKNYAPLFALDADADTSSALALDGPLAGVPVAVKDVFDTRDLPTAYGSPIYSLP